jgi:NhaA family Na+:H+ antiporter
VAGVGFTISLLITDLAFAGSPLLEAAKAGILAASVLAGIVGAVILSRGGARATGPAE